MNHTGIKKRIYGQKQHLLNNMLHQIYSLLPQLPYDLHVEALLFFVHGKSEKKKQMVTLIFKKAM